MLDADSYLIHGNYPFVHKTTLSCLIRQDFLPSAPKAADLGLRAHSKITSYFIRRCITYYFKG
jgi:hypothetical protein